MKLKKPKSTTWRRSGPPGSPSARLACTVSRTSSALGPTKMRSRVTPSTSPTAAPSTSTLVRLLGSGLAGSLGTWIVLRKVTMRRLRGQVGQEDGREVLVLRTSPLERTAQRCCRR